MKHCAINFRKTTDPELRLDSRRSAFLRLATLSSFAKNTGMILHPNDRHKICVNDAMRLETVIYAGRRMARASRLRFTLFFSLTKLTTPVNSE